jgi:hypothetical protein
MERPAMIRFFTVKRLIASETHTELKSLCGPEALALRTVKKCGRRFQQERMNLFDDPKSGRPLTNAFAEAIDSVFEERPFSSWKGFSATSGLERRGLADLSRQAWPEKSIFAGRRMPLSIN